MNGIVARPNSSGGRPTACSNAFRTCAGRGIRFGPPAVYGAVAASLGAVCALSALVMSIDRGVNGVFLGFTIGFLCRAVLVGAGLMTSGARGGLAVVYVAAFFALYAVTQIVEVLFVRAHSRGATT